MPIWSWCEIDDEWTSAAGWPDDDEGWPEQLRLPNLRVYRSGRGHLAISVRAETLDEARRMVEPLLAE